LNDEALQNGVVSTDLPIYTLVNSSDIVFTGMSTVGSEAVLFDKPLICLNFSRISYGVRYDEAHVALLVKNEEEILPAIVSVLHDNKVSRKLEEGRKLFRERYAYKLDGRASERFVAAIRLAIDSTAR
jgi:UDP-N-acetylglucosamine 2-epimerase